MIALGGYGRGELNPFSDIDVMLLHQSGKEGDFAASGGDGEPGSLSLMGQRLQSRTFHPLDQGSGRSGEQDMRTKTAMLELGFSPVTPSWRKNFGAISFQVRQGYEREYVELRMEDQVARHKKFGDSVYLQEPNLKSGCGGLRDYQNLLWMTYFKEGSLSTNQLVGKDWLSESDQRRIEKAYDFLLRLRTALHYATGRATDILHINLQEEIAKRLGYSPGNGQLRSEDSCGITTSTHETSSGSRNELRSSLSADMSQARPVRCSVFSL